MLLRLSDFYRSAFASGDDFLAVLKPFLKKLPIGYRFALEWAQDPAACASSARSNFGPGRALTSVSVKR